MKSSVQQLFMPKCGDGIEVGRPYRGVQAEDDAYGEADPRGKRDTRGCDYRGHAGVGRNDPWNNNADSNTDQASHHRQHDRFDKEL